MTEPSNPYIGVFPNKPPNMYELVEHPAHYNNQVPGIECIDVIQWFPTNVGLVIKHLWRAGSKPENPRLLDLEKALVYLQKEIEREKFLLGKGEAG